MATAVMLVLVLVGIALSVLDAVFRYPPLRRGGPFPPRARVDPSRPVVPWGTPGSVGVSLPDGCGGYYGVAVMPAPAPGAPG